MLAYREEGWFRFALAGSRCQNRSGGTETPTAGVEKGIPLSGTPIRFEGPLQALQGVKNASDGNPTGRTIREAQRTNGG